MLNQEQDKHPDSPYIFPCHSLGKCVTKLAALKPHKVNAFFASLTKDGTKEDRKPDGYSKASIMKTRNVFSFMLKTATEWEVIDRNPCDKVRLKGASAEEKTPIFTSDMIIWKSLISSMLAVINTFTILGAHTLQKIILLRNSFRNK